MDSEKGTEPEDSSSQDTQTHEQKLRIMLTALWDRSRHTVAERGLLLEECCTLLREHRLDEASRLRAVDSAHKLAGVLGTFGLPRGTELAREAETLFNQTVQPEPARVARLQSLLAELTSLIDRGPR